MQLVPAAPGEVVLQHVSRRFGDVHVLEDVSQVLPSGSLTAIIGDNGSGKTSLLRIIAGTLLPDAGAVTISGLPPGNGLAAIVPAGDRALYWRLTGAQELGFFARLTGVERDEARNLTTKAAELLEVEHLADRQIGTFSTGQRRRLMVARSLVGRAPVLLLDEPYADLDPTARDVVERALRRWTDHGGAAVWTSPTVEGGPRSDAALHLRNGMLVRV
jgi:ABC-type multidrug transport system ATPase subunit